MNLATLDWIIVGMLLATLTGAALRTKRYGNSVSGFLAANRCAGRYLISVAFNMAQLHEARLLPRLLDRGGAGDRPRGPGLPACAGRRLSTSAFDGADVRVPGVGANPDQVAGTAGRALR